MAAREQIVIIDDDESMLQLIARALDEDGFTCRVFNSAVAALLQLDRMTPICVLVDVRMPEMDGLAFLHELRKSHASLPVVVMTGFADHEVFRRTLRHHVSDFLAKPFSPQVLRDALRRALGRDDTFAEQFLETVTHRLRETRQS